MGKRVDITGQRFYNLVALEPTGDHDIKKNVLWLCKCDCGNTTIVPTCRLIHGRTKSCGCRRQEAAHWIKFKHGYSKDPVYDVWKQMKLRCNNPTNIQYFRYGGRGIKVCSRWEGEEGFMNFKDDMGPRPNKYTLERVDNNGDYSPENCKWATSKEQMGNTRRSILVSILGEVMCLAEVSRRFGLSSDRIADRIQRGYSIALALFLPILDRKASRELGKFAKRKRELNSLKY